MALRLIQIENHLGKAKAGTRKWLKNQRNRWIRKQKGKPIINKYKDWEY